MTDNMSGWSDEIERLRGLHPELGLAYADLIETTVSGSAGGGLVTITMQCTGEVVGVHFEQAAVDEGNAAALAALTMSAHQHAIDNVKSVVEERFATATDEIEGSWR